MSNKINIEGLEEIKKRMSNLITELQNLKNTSEAASSNLNSQIMDLQSQIKTANEEIDKILNIKKERNSAVSVEESGVSEEKDDTTGVGDGKKRRKKKSKKSKKSDGGRKKRRSKSRKVRKY